MIGWTIRWWEGSNLPWAQESKAGPTLVQGAGIALLTFRSPASVPSHTASHLQRETFHLGTLPTNSYRRSSISGRLRWWVKVELLDGDHRGPLAIGRFDLAAILALAADDDDAPASGDWRAFGQGTPGPLRIRTSYQLVVRTRQWDIMLRMCRRGSMPTLRRSQLHHHIPHFQWHKV